MLYNIKCPKCGAEQRGLNLKETEGLFICSECGEEIQVNPYEIETDEKCSIYNNEKN